MVNQTKQSIKFYNKEASTYDERRWATAAGKYIDGVQKKILLNLVGSCEGLRVLDIAAGTGRFSIELAKRGAIVTILDSSQNMLNKAKEKFENEGLIKRLTICNSVATELPFDNDEFDVCICINAMNHIPGFDVVLSGIERVLKKGGLSVTNYTNWVSYYLPFGVWANLNKKSITRDVYTKWFNLPEIKSAHRQVKLEITEITGAVQFPAKTNNVVLLSFYKWLDVLSRSGALKYLAPLLFISARKK